MSATYEGLTWDHPRGYAALQAAAQDSGGLVSWYTQPLEGFESASIAELCARYDLVVMDHPHLGEAVAAGCIQPLDKLFAATELVRMERATVGASYASYNMGGQQWALPLDAASQVMALRADLLSQAAPATWQEVVGIAEKGVGVALCLAGPHALLSFLSIAAAIQPDCDLRNGDCWIDRAVAQEAWAILSQLAKRALTTTFELNPIGLLEAMTDTDEIVLCPLVFGYVNYANPGLAKPLTFVDAPAMQSGGVPGSIIGGTGIAISSRCDVDDALRTHLQWLLDDDTQTRFIPGHAGQPSALASWRDPALNRAWGGFYANTLNTLQHARIRPRHDGFITFQTRASAWLREALVQGHDAPRTLDSLDALFRESHEKRSA